MADKAIKNSFARVKADIIQLQNNDTAIDKFARETAARIKRLEDQLNFLGDLLRSMDKAGFTTGNTLIASREGTKAHTKNCPFGKNIKAEKKQFYNSVEEATSKGLELCECATA